MKNGRFRAGSVLILAFAGFAIALALGELALRAATQAPWLCPMDPPEDALVVEHPVRGYALRPDLSRRWARAGFDVAVELNELGHRDSPFSEAQTAGIRLLAAGDSYTFGIGVESHETWAERIEQALDAEGVRGGAAVVNTGVPGYSARQIRQVIQEVVPVLRPHAVIFAMYASSYWRVRNPYQIKGGTLITSNRVSAVEIASDGTLVMTPFSPGALRTLDLWLKDHFHLGARVLSLVNGGRHWAANTRSTATEDPLPQKYEPALAEIRRTHHWLKERQIPLLLLAVNNQLQSGGFEPLEARYNEILADFAASEGIRFVDPLPRFDATADGEPIFVLSDDTHWTAAAHAIAAEMVLEALREDVWSGREWATLP